MPITTNHLAALGAVDYDADGALTPADHAAARRDASVLNPHVGAPDAVDHRDGGRLARTLLRAPAPLRTSLAEGIGQACGRLRRGAARVEIERHDWRTAADVVHECDRAERILERTPIGPHARTQRGTHVVSQGALERAWAIGSETNPLPRGLLSSGTTALGALDLLVRSADGPVASPASAWSSLLPITAPSQPVDRFAHRVLEALRDAGATLYVSPRLSAVFSDPDAARARLADIYTDTPWQGDPIETAGRLYVTWPENGPAEIRVPLDELTGIAGTQLRIQRNASVRFLRLPGDIVVLDSLRGVRGNWKTGWASLQSMVFADQAPAPYAAWRASFLGASIDESGILGPWGEMSSVPAHANALERAWGRMTWELDRGLVHDAPEPETLEQALERYREVERIVPALSNLDA